MQTVKQLVDDCFVFRADWVAYSCILPVLLSLNFLLSGSIQVQNPIHVLALLSLFIPHLPPEIVLKALSRFCHYLRYRLRKDKKFFVCTFRTAIPDRKEESDSRDTIGAVGIFDVQSTVNHRGQCCPYAIKQLFLQRTRLARFFFDCQDNCFMNSRFGEFFI